MASFTFKPYHQQAQLQFTSYSHCKYSSSTLNVFKFHSQPILPPPSRKHKPLLVNTSSHPDTEVSDLNSPPNHESFNFPSAYRNAGRKVILRDRNANKGLNPKTGRGEDKDRNLVVKNSDRKVQSWKEGGVDKDGANEGVVENKGRKSKKPKDQVLDGSNGELVEKKGKGGSKKTTVHLPNGSNEVVVVVEKKGRASKKAKAHLPELTMRVGLDMCSKRGDVMGAIELYELAKKEGTKMGQYHFGVLMYLCSSAAIGMVQPAKSGSRSRTLNPGDLLMESSVGSDSMGELSEKGEGCYDSQAEEVAFGGPNTDSDGEENVSMEVPPRRLDGIAQELEKRDSERLKPRVGGNETNEIQMSEDVQRFALQKGFEIYNEMLAEKIPMNEATLTSVARMAIAFQDGDMAFDMVKQMKEYGINPRLRSYGPALAIFAGKGDIEKAFMVENHMLAHGVYPEEPELGTLLKVSIGAAKSDKVYYVMHKLRTSTRQVSPATADLIQSWFESKTAARVGKRKWSENLITEAIVNGGGGWHGMGWLGAGKWKVCRSTIGSNGICKSCGEKLVTIDLDPEETEKFAQSVASLAAQREKHLNFEKFQKWLDHYGPFEAVVDGANVGLLNTRNFKPSKVNVIANAMRQKSPSKKWPLIVLHNRRITDRRMNEPLNRAIIERWKNADALYATPTGSNDDWYWLYAAIKCKCLLVTNDEMRDHLFQLLGNDFFPKWKERHQVRFGFSESGTEIRMPPPYSVSIQESEKGHWHVPIAYEVEDEDQRIWLCCTRANSNLADQDSVRLEEELAHSRQKKGEAPKGARKGNRIKKQLEFHESQNPSKQEFQELDSNIKTASSMSDNHHSVLPRIEAAEKFGSCLIDFQI